MGAPPTVGLAAKVAVAKAIAAVEAAKSVLKVMVSLPCEARRLCLAIQETRVDPGGKFQNATNIVVIDDPAHRGAFNFRPKRPKLKSASAPDLTIGAAQRMTAL
ncbi:hypothetical protein NBRC116586_15750 [Pseudooceanicola nitratireducens]